MYDFIFIEVKENPVLFVIMSTNSQFQEHVKRYSFFLKFVWWWYFLAEIFNKYFSNVYNSRKIDKRADPNMSVHTYLGPRVFFQAEHALYTPGLDENRGSGNFVHDIWMCYKVQFAKFLMVIR